MICISLSVEARMDQRKQKESKADYVDKMRQLFLLQISINLKRTEIDKLDKRSQLKAEAMLESELALKGDADEFEAFLQENDNKAQEAVRANERQTKMKMEKIQQIKRLNQNLQTLQSALKKDRDALEECLRFKSFLDELTPNEWFEKETYNNTGNLSYFSHPLQLLEVISSLEEDNLFLIQNMQEAEQSLEEMKGEFQDTKDKEQQNANVLRDNIKHINSQIRIKEEDIVLMKDRLTGKYDSVHKKELGFLQDLNNRVKQIYKVCGFSSSGSTPSTLFMLAELEAGMDSILLNLENMPPFDFKKIEKCKEKNRREMNRIFLQQKLQSRKENRKVLESKQ